MTPAEREDQISEMTLEAVDGLMQKLPMLTDRKNAMGVLLIISYNLLRSAESDEFMRGWLESALEDVKHNAPAMELKGAH